MLRIRSLRPAKLVNNCNRINRFSTVNKGPKPEPYRPNLNPDAPKKSASGTIVRSFTMITLFSTTVFGLFVAYRLETDTYADKIINEKAHFVYEAVKPLRSLLKTVGIVKTVPAPVKPVVAAPVAPKIEKVIEEAKREVAEIVVVADPVETIKHAEQVIIEKVEEAVATTSEASIEEHPAVVEDVKAPETQSHFVEEKMHENQQQEEQAHQFSAHEEAHDLEVKYNMVTDESAVTHSTAPAAPTHVQPSLNELNQTTLHYELQSQARKILSELQEELHHSKIKELIVQHEQEMQSALKKQKEEFEAQLKHDLEKQEKHINRMLQDDLNHQVAVLRQSQVEEMLAMQPKIDGLKANLKTFEVIADETSAAIQETLRSNQLSSAILALEFALSIPTGQRGNVASHFDNLKLACKDDALVSSVVAALPKTVLQNGALNNSELHLRFNIMKDEVRKVALAPEEAPKMIGQMIGTVLAFLTWAPKGYVSGTGVEDILARAEFYLERGHVREALAELHHVQGYSKVLMADFESLANVRLLVDQSIAILKAKSVLKHKALVP